MVFLSADQGERSEHPDRQTPRVRLLSRGNQRMNIHPTDAAAASPIWPCLSMPKSSPAKTARKALSTSASAAMIPQNHPLDSLKTLFSQAADQSSPGEQNRIFGPPGIQWRCDQSALLLSGAKLRFCGIVNAGAR